MEACLLLVKFLGKKEPPCFNPDGRLQMILAADVGGTNTRLGLFSKDGTCLAETKVLNRSASSLEELIDAFLQPHPKVERACFAVAGHIEHDRCHMTNLNWTIDAKLIGKKFSIPNVHLINDIEAHAFGLSLISKDEMDLLQAGKRQTGNQAVVFCGTGLGEAGLFWDGTRFCASAGEGGHVDFAPRNELEIELFLFLQKKYGHVSYERVVSGLGIYDMYQFFVEVKKVPSSGIDSIFQMISGRRTDAACRKVVDLFL